LIDPTRPPEDYGWQVIYHLFNMDAEEILRQAWEAVEGAGIPESLHEVAFREAVAILTMNDGRNARSQTPTKPKTSSRAGTGGRRQHGRTSRAVAGQQEVVIPDEDTFFSKLSHESGVPENDLRDILQLTRDGNVHVTQATRALGSNMAEQARTAVALVASARAFGLSETPVDGAAVREEVKKKRCFNGPNYAASTIGRLRGFNQGSTRNQIVTTSGWSDDFKAAVDQAHGRSESPDG
jgi:hypothetical protein